MRAFYASFIAMPVALAASPAAGTPATETQAICKAAIAAIFGRDPATINATAPTLGITTLSYVRPNDNTRWVNRCKLNGDQVLWASETGRWRDHPQDEKITFERGDAGVTIIQTFGDGSKIQDTFPRSKL